LSGRQKLRNPFPAVMREGVRGRRSARVIVVVNRQMVWVGGVQVMIRPVRMGLLPAFVMMTVVMMFMIVVNVFVAVVALAVMDVFRCARIDKGRG